MIVLNISRKTQMLGTSRGFCIGTSSARVCLLPSNRWRCLHVVLAGAQGWKGSVIYNRTVVATQALSDLTIVPAGRESRQRTGTAAIEYSENR
jgi:hypothetical protein